MCLCVAVCFYIRLGLSFNSQLHVLLIYVLVMNFIRDVHFQSHCVYVSGAHQMLRDGVRRKSKRRLSVVGYIVIVIVVACCRCVLTCEHLSFLLPFKFRLIEYYMVNIAANADLS